MGDVRDQPDKLLAIDADIARLFEHAITTDDPLAASLDMAQIDLLLDHRYAITEASSDQ